MSGGAAHPLRQARACARNQLLLFLGYGRQRRPRITQRRNGSKHTPSLPSRQRCSSSQLAHPDGRLMAMPASGPREKAWNYALHHITTLKP